MIAHATHHFANTNFFESLARYGNRGVGEVKTRQQQQQPTHDHGHRFGYIWCTTYQIVAVEPGVCSITLHHTPKFFEVIFTYHKILPRLVLRFYIVLQLLGNASYFGGVFDFQKQHVCPFFPIGLAQIPIRVNIPVIIEKRNDIKPKTVVLFWFLKYASNLKFLWPAHAI